MAKEKIKNLSISELKKQSKKLDGQTEVFMTIGDSEYKVLIDETFRKTKIYKLMDDLIEFLNESINNAVITELATPYIALLSIKHFTNIEVSDNIDEALEVLDYLIDLEVLDKLVNAMPEDEVVRLYEHLADVIKNMEKNIIENQEEAEALVNQLENQEVKDMIQNG